MSRIHILPDHLVSQIAAGEVVERPASVLKELIENSLDADAGRLEIDLEHGGKRRIRLVDDGHGMDRDDALLAFDRHATSKISSFEDLEVVSSFGFRGEALASIAAVAKVDLTTATESGEGFRVRIEGGRVRKAEPVGAPRGTSVEVASLFYNVPARRRFLKTPRTELARSTEVVQAYALARPAVGLTARHGGRTLLEVGPGSDDEEGLSRRLLDLFGEELVDASTPFAAEPAPGLRLWGRVGDPSTARSRRRFSFVNRRLVRDRAVLANFYRAVRDEWHSDDFPALFLFIDLPGSEVDVNVHPQKAEVRFRDQRILRRTYDTLREALGTARGEAPVRPSLVREPPGAPLAWQGSAWEPRPDGEGETRRHGEGWRFEGEQGTDRVGAARLPQAAFEPLEPRAVPLSGRSGAERPFSLLGQYKGTVLLLEGPDGLYLIDQHVAHERILYERVRRNLAADEPQSQRLLEPRLIELSRSETLRLEPFVDELERFGFELAILSGSTLALAAVPAGLGQDEAEEVLRQLASGDESSDDPGDLERRLVEEAAASISCRAAVKMHEPLGAEEMKQLVTDLFACESPFSCPHGRPILLKITDRELETAYQRR